MSSVEYLNDPAVQAALHVSTMPNPVPDRNSGTVTPTTTTTTTATQHDIPNDNSGTPTTSAKVKAKPPRRWDFCSDEVNENWAFNDYLADTTALYRAIYTHPHKPKGFKMLVYSGDIDGVSLMYCVLCTSYYVLRTMYCV